MKRLLAISCLSTILTSCGDRSAYAIKQLVAGEDNGFADMRGDVTGEDAGYAVLTSRMQVPGMECTLRVSRKARPYTADAICVERFATRPQADAAYAGMQTRISAALPGFSARDRREHDVTPPTLVRGTDYTSELHLVMLSETVHWKTYPSYGYNAIVDYYQIALYFASLERTQ